MSKRNLSCLSGSSGNSSRKSAGKFVIPTLLKTEEIVVEDEIKQEISTPCTGSKSLVKAGRPDNTIFYTCGGCGESGTHYLGLEYRLVKTATVMEVGTQTGNDEMSVGPVKMEITDPFYYDSVPATSGTVPIVGELRFY